MFTGGKIELFHTRANTKERGEKTKITIKPPFHLYSTRDSRFGTGKKVAVFNFLSLRWLHFEEPRFLTRIQIQMKLLLLNKKDFFCLLMKLLLSFKVPQKVFDANRAPT